MRKFHGNKTVAGYVSPPVKVKTVKRPRAATEARTQTQPTPTPEVVPTMKTADVPGFLKDWALNALPFALIDAHRLFHQRKVIWGDSGALHILNRHLLQKMMVKYGETLLQEKLDANAGQFASVALDLGTMQSKRTMDVIIHTAGQEFLYSVESVPKGEGTAAALWEKLQPILADLKQRNIKVVAVVTDNASNLTAMERLINDVYPEILVINCGIHSLQLLVTQVIYDLPEIVSALTVVEDVRNAVKKNHNLSKVPVLAPTRWNYLVNVLELIAKRFQKYKDNGCITVAQLGAIDRALFILKPFQIVTKYLERTKANVIDTAESLHTLHGHITTMPDHVRSAFEHRLTLHFSSDAHIMAVVFAFPYFSWSTLPVPNRRFIASALARLCKKWGINGLAAHGQLQSLFEGAPQQRERQEKNTAASFWSKMSVYTPELYAIYQRLIATSASEAACERAFSRQKRQHTDLRNRLDVSSICALLRVCTINSENPLHQEENEDETELDAVGHGYAPTDMKAFIDTLVFTSRFAAGQDVEIGDVLRVTVVEKNALRDYKATVTSFNAPPDYERKQVFYAKELPMKYDADGNERTPRERFMYNTYVNVQYHNAQNVQCGRFYALNLLERSHAKSDEWELWQEMA